jgi:hypothetical protein
VLFTFHVSSGARSYVTQHPADDWQGAKEALVGSEAFRQFTEAAIPASRQEPISERDVFLVVPMTGLKHCWLMQGGRSGEYFTAVVVRTDESGAVEEPCGHGESSVATPE